MKGEIINLDKCAGGAGGGALMREKPEGFQGQWITGQPYVVERGRTW